MKNKFLALTLLALLTACGSTPTTTPANVNTGNNGIQQVGIDPKFAWTAPTTYCDGSTITNTLNYNVYASTSPIPTITNSASLCNGGTYIEVDRTKISPLNSAPITALSYNTNLTQSQTYYAVVTAVDAITGNEGSPSPQVTFSVELYPSGPGAPVVTFCLAGSNSDGTCE